MRYAGQEHPAVVARRQEPRTVPGHGEATIGHRYSRDRYREDVQSVNPMVREGPRGHHTGNDFQGCPSPRDHRSRQHAPGPEKLAGLFQKIHRRLIHAWGSLLSFLSPPNSEHRPDSGVPCPQTVQATNVTHEGSHGCKTSAAQTHAATFPGHRQHGLVSGVRAQGHCVVKGSPMVRILHPPTHRRRPVLRGSISVLRVGSQVRGPRALPP